VLDKWYYPNPMVERMIKGIPYNEEVQEGVITPNIIQLEYLVNVQDQRESHVCPLLGGRGEDPSHTFHKVNLGKSRNQLLMESIERDKRLNQGC